MCWVQVVLSALSPLGRQARGRWPWGGDGGCKLVRELHVGGSVCARGRGAWVVME